MLRPLWVADVTLWPGRRGVRAFVAHPFLILFVSLSLFSILNTLRRLYIHTKIVPLPYGVREYGTVVFEYGIVLHAATGHCGVTAAAAAGAAVARPASVRSGHCQPTDCRWATPRPSTALHSHARTHARTYTQTERCSRESERACATAECLGTAAARRHT